MCAKWIPHWLPVAPQTPQAIIVVVFAAKGQTKQEIMASCSLTPVADAIP